MYCRGPSTSTTSALCCPVEVHAIILNANSKGLMNEWISNYVLFRYGMGVHLVQPVHRLFKLARIQRLNKIKLNNRRRRRRLKDSVQRLSELLYFFLSDLRVFILQGSSEFFPFISYIIWDTFFASKLRFRLF